MPPLTLDPSYCYSVKELSFLLNLSTETIRRLFVHEPGTVILCTQRTGRRLYRTMRIPGHVALRVWARFTVT